MPVIKFDPNLSNFIIHGDRRFFLTSFGSRPFLVRDNCPHRGGPLHLGYLVCNRSARSKNYEKDAIICPWHNSTVSIQRLQRHAVPLVWRRDIAVAILSGAELTPIIVKHSQILVTV